MLLIIKIYNLFIKNVCILQSLTLFILRLWIAQVFFLSGLVKINNFENTIALFSDEYKVPFIPPMFAAVSATIFELSCPVLLTIGLASRLSTLPLLAMTAVIQFTYDQNIQHSYWAMILITILAFGPGKLSIDHFIYNKFNKKA
jgi:putative oxidoreductase